MNFENPILLGVVGMIFACVLGVFCISYFSTEARLERKRRRNNGRIVNQARRPTVKFSAKVEKE